MPFFRDLFEARARSSEDASFEKLWHNDSHSTCSTCLHLKSSQLQPRCQDNETSLMLRSFSPAGNLNFGSEQTAIRAVTMRPAMGPVHLQLHLLSCLGRRYERICLPGRRVSSLRHLHLPKSCGCDWTPTRSLVWPHVIFPSCDPYAAQVNLHMQVRDVACACVAAAA